MPLLTFGQAFGDWFAYELGDPKPLATLTQMSRESSWRDRRSLATRWAKRHPTLSGYLRIPYITGGYDFYQIRDGKASASNAAECLPKLDAYQRR